MTAGLNSGREWMKQEGLSDAIDFDIDLLMDKTFTSYRKTKSMNKHIFFRWHNANMVNMHYTRSTN